MTQEQEVRLDVAAHSQEILEAVVQYRLVLLTRVEEPKPPYKKGAHARHNAYLSAWQRSMTHLLDTIRKTRSNTTGKVYTNE